MKIVLWCVTVALLAAVQAQHQHTECCEEYCYGTDSERPQTKWHSTKTPYQIVRGVDAQRNTNVPNCTPQKFWMLARHGTRLPSAKSMQKLKTLVDLRDQVIENYEQRRTKPDVGALCDADYQTLKAWRWDSNITGDHDEFLTIQGWNDLKYLAKSFQRILPTVLETVYTPDKYQFRFTNTERTQSSYRAFVEGLFGDNAYQHIQTPAAAENDTLLKPYDSCPMWIEQEAKLDLPSSEVNKFIASDTYQEMLNEVSLRLGFKFQLTEKQVELIWDQCRFEQAWYIDRLSPWCAAFTKAHVNILEYKEDLKYYYKSGFGGAPLNEKVACHAITDMLKHLEATTGPKVASYFSHSTAVNLLLTAMGVLRDPVPLRADNYNQMQRRLFRSSQMGPFAANLVAIKYDCPTEAQKTKVIFLLNEKPLDIPWCRVGLCDWDLVMQHYRQYLTGTDCQNVYCGGSSGSNMLQTSFALVVAIFVFPVITIVKLY